MPKAISAGGNGFINSAVFVWVLMIISFFTAMTVIIFPIMVFKTTPATHVVEGVNGYVSLSGVDNTDKEIFALNGEWEFYPNRLYSFEDFRNGRIEESRVVQFPHYWRDEPSDVIDRVGYATYRMRVRVPSSFDGIGIYSRYQYSAYKIFLNDILICSAGEVSENPDEYLPVYLPSNGYTNYSIGGEGRTLSVILHVQNLDSDSGGFSNNILIGTSQPIKDLRTLLVMVNGFVSGGLLTLFVCLSLIYLSGRERREYLDYTIVSLTALFFSLTNGGESIMYSIGIDSVLLVRLEYCAIITGAFFANYNVIRELVKSKVIFYSIHLYVVAALAFFLCAPILLASKPMVRMPIISLTSAFFVLPLIRSLKGTILKRDFNSITSLISYVIVTAGMVYNMLGIKPYDSIDILSIAILLHCLMQMVIFMHRHRRTELALKDMTETLGERIEERTRELTLMKERAEAATVAKSNFLATMSHEIRTPMNAIMGISDLMRVDNLDKEQLGYLMDIKKSSKALLQIINDILDFSKIEAGKLEINPVHFNLMEVYDNICSICLFSAEAKDLEFRNSFAPDIPHYIYGDEIRFRQVLLNILNNAIKYTKEGFVYFAVAKTELNGKPFLRFVVEDSGIGIKEEDFLKLFDSFEQLDSASNRKIVGTGLGLSITKLLVSLMDGEIEVSSEYGRGSVFTILLPLCEGDSSKVSVQEAYVPVMAGGANVLVVDDNTINLTVASGFLATHGIKAQTAISGAEAIEKIKNNRFDLVFMDHMMPEMDGVEATRLIREMDEGRELPIIALTANAVSGAKDIFKEAGMNDFLSKPINAAQLNILLARWLPEEKITYDIIENGGLGDINDRESLIFDRLFKIDGLSVTKGLSHVANNKAAYIGILKQFCKELDKYTTDIMNDYMSGDWADYTIKLHAMKGVFANIGEESLSQQAYRLELASRGGENPPTLDETVSFCEEMEFFRDKLVTVELFENVEPTEKTPIDAQELAEMLRQLKTVCMFGDSDSAEEICERLKTRSFNEEIDPLLDEIDSLASSFDFEIVAVKIDHALTLL